MARRVTKRINYYSVWRHFFFWGLSFWGLLIQDCYFWVLFSLSRVPSGFIWVSFYFSSCCCDTIIFLLGINKVHPCIHLSTYPSIQTKVTCTVYEKTRTSVIKHLPLPPLRYLCPDNKVHILASSRYWHALSVQVAPIGHHSPTINQTKGLLSFFYLSSLHLVLWHNCVFYVPVICLFEVWYVEETLSFGIWSTVSMSKNATCRSLFKVFVQPSKKINYDWAD